MTSHDRARKLLCRIWIPSLRGGGGGGLSIQAWRGCCPGICRLNLYAGFTDLYKLERGWPWGSCPQLPNAVALQEKKGNVGLLQPPLPLLGGQEQNSVKMRISS